MSLSNEYTPLPPGPSSSPPSYGAIRPTIDTDVERLLNPAFDRRASGEDPNASEEPSDSDDAASADELAIRASIGVKTVEATQRVYGPLSKRLLFVGIALAAYIHSLDATTTFSFTTFAASEFKAHSLIGAISVTQGVIIAVGKPVIAKIADASSRGTAYLFVVFLYVLGYFTASLSPSIPIFVIGAVFAAIASSSLQLLTQILIADHTTLRARGLVSSLSQVPFIVNAPLGAYISARILQGASWRLGYGLFMLIVPLCLAPVVIVLLWSEARAKRHGLVPTPGDGLPEDYRASSSPLRRRADASPLSPLHPRHGSSRRLSRMSGMPLTRWERAQRFGAALDLVGLLLLVCGVALLLVPLTLNGASTPAPPAQDAAQDDPNFWTTASMAARDHHIMLFTAGVVFIAVFAWWETRFASSPVIAPAFVKNRAVVITAFIGFCDFASFYLTYTYLFSFIIVVKGWSMTATNNFMQIQGTSMTFCGIAAGVIMVRRQRYKHVLVGGLTVRLAGVLLMLYTRRSTASSLALISTQVLQGIGGGVAAISLQVGAQASVSHSDLAIVTAVVLLLTEIGGAVGGALSGAIWANLLPGKLAEHLPDISVAERDKLFGSIDEVLKYTPGNPIREGVAGAYSDTMWLMVVAATIFAILPFVLSLRLPDLSLSDKQSSVEDDATHRRRSRSFSRSFNSRSVSRGRGRTSPISA